MVDTLIDTAFSAATLSVPVCRGYVCRVMAIMSDKFTPGPWEFTYDGSSDWSIGPAADPQGRRVARCWVPLKRQTSTMRHGVEVADIPADVRLIAQAPTAHQLVRDALAIFDADLDCAQDAVVGTPHTVRHPPEIQSWTKAARAYLAAVDGEEERR